MPTDLFERLKKAKAQPKLSGVARRVLDLVQSEDAALGQVADVLSSDPGLASRLLRFVNSPLLGSSPQVSSIPEVVNLLGLRGAKLLALGFSLVSPELRSAIPGFEFRRFWARALARAVSARSIAERSGRHDPLEAFLSGLLARFGQLVLVTGLPEEYSRVLQVAEGRPGALGAAEHAVLGMTHVTLGARVLEEWCFPPDLCKAIIEFPTATPGRAAGEPPGLPEILYTADLAAAVVSDPAEHQAPRVAELLAAVEVFFAWEEASWAEVFGQIARHLRECGTLLAIETPEVRAFGEIQSEAAEQIAEFTLAMHVENQIQLERQKDLLRLASVDRLTAVGNRAAFDERLQHELDRARRTQRPVALLLVDLDGLKQVNDTFGHEAGDRLLREVAAELIRRTRRVDLVARCGANQFAVIAPEADPDGAAILAERLRAGVEQLAVDWSGQRLQVTACVGGAVARWPERPRSADEIIAAADAQLYLAKRVGRNCCAVEPRA